MKSKTKYLILLVAIVGLIFLIFSSIKWMYWDLEYLLLAKILYAIGLISFVCYFSVNNWQKILMKLMLPSFLVSLIISVYLSYAYFDLEKSIATTTKYESANCDELKGFFATDLKNNEVKYFQYGMGPDIELFQNLKSKYGIESYGMGCIKLSTIECYNDLVNNYLIEKHNDHILNGKQNVVDKK